LGQSEIREVGSGEIECGEIPSFKPGFNPVKQRRIQPSRFNGFSRVVKKR
jgi:hypothetical protein